METQINVPGLQPFVVHGDPNKVAQNWGKWRKSFQHFLDASRITSDTRKKAMHMAGPQTQEVFETLNPVDNTYDKALEVLNTHVAVNKNIPFECSLFRQARQKQGESTEQFVTHLCNSIYI